MHPDFVIEKGMQENLIHCILHARRLLTLEEGLRWQDIKRYGIVIYRRYYEGYTLVNITDRWTRMTPDVQFNYRPVSLRQVCNQIQEMTN